MTAAGDLDGVLSLEQAKQHLNITGARHDAELPGFIAAAVRVVGRYLDQEVTSREVTEQRTLRREMDQLVLDHTPAVQLLAVIVDGAPRDVTSMQLDADSGVLTLHPYRGVPLYGRVQVTYRVGRDATPDDIGMAVRMVLRDLWRSQRPPSTGGGRYGGRDGDEIDVAAGYVISVAAKQLLGYPAPGVA